VRPLDEKGATALKIIIDGNNIAMRNHFKLPNMKSSKGTHTGAIYGFLSTVLMLKHKFQPSEIVVAWDGGRAAWRKELYPEYKGNRERKESLNVFFDQLKIIREICKSLNVKTYWNFGCEADDLIALEIIKNRSENFQTIVYSSDEDFAQLVNEQTFLVSPATNEKNDVLGKLECNAKEFLYSKCIAGDSSDNIKGLAGIGHITALKTVKRIKPKSIECLNSNEAHRIYAGSGKRWWQVGTSTYHNIIFRNYKMMCLEFGVLQLPSDLSEPVVGKFNPAVLDLHFQDLDFSKYSSKIDDFK